MTSFRNDYGFIVSNIFLISSALLIVLIVTTVIKKIKNKLENIQLKKG